MINKLYLCSFIFVFLTLFSFSVSAKKQFIEWHSSNIQVLRGHDYELGSERRTIVTFEHANRWAYGDFYIFGDKDWPDQGPSSHYYEPTLRFSLNKIMGRSPSKGVIKDWFLATQYEKPKGQRGRNLYGLAVDWNIPGFVFFKTMLFSRNNPNLAGDTQQLTVAWNYPFNIKGVNYLTEGFTDLAGAEGTTVANQLFVPRLLVDASPWAGLPDKKLWLGIEWQYWHNKFGVDGVTESVPQVQVKYVF